MTVRIGVLSDLHCELEPAGSRWINVFEPEHLDRRTDAALAWFAEAEVDLILLLGDIVQFANPSDLAHMFARLAAADVAPLATVNGNHDSASAKSSPSAPASTGSGCSTRSRSLRGVRDRCRGQRGPAPPQYVGRFAGSGGEADLVVVASHFPLLSEASRVAAAGLPYAGDLVNRADLEAQLRSDPRPKVVLSGHIHARCSTTTGRCCSSRSAP